MAQIKFSPINNEEEVKLTCTTDPLLKGQDYEFEVQVEVKNQESGEVVEEDSISIVVNGEGSEVKEKLSWDLEQGSYFVSGELLEDEEIIDTTGTILGIKKDVKPTVHRKGETGGLEKKEKEKDSEELSIKDFVIDEVFWVERENASVDFTVKEAEGEGYSFMFNRYYDEWKKTGKYSEEVRERKQRELIRREASKGIAFKIMCNMNPEDIKNVYYQKFLQELIKGD